MRLIALPGLDGTGDLFRWLVREAPRGFEVEAVAYPSDQVLDYGGHLEIARQRLPCLPHQRTFLLLGESFSGPVAIRLAAESPPGLAGLVLCNSFVLPPGWSGFRHLPWENLFQGSVPKAVIRRYLAGPWTSPELVAAVRAANRNVAPEVRAARIREALAVDASEDLARVRVPILCLRGTRDRLVRERSLRALRSARPEARIARIEAPHLLLQVAPREAWAAIQALVDGSESAAAT